MRSYILEKLKKKVDNLETVIYSRVSEQELNKVIKETVSEIESEINAVESKLHDDQKHIFGSLNDNGGCIGCATFIYMPGMIISIILSLGINNSILLAIVHGYLSWLYVVYFIFLK